MSKTSADLAPKRLTPSAVEKAYKAGMRRRTDGTFDRGVWRIYREGLREREPKIATEQSGKDDRQARSQVAAFLPSLTRSLGQFFDDQYRAVFRKFEEDLISRTILDSGYARPGHKSTKGAQAFLAKLLTTKKVVQFAGFRSEFSGKEKKGLWQVSVFLNKLLREIGLGDVWVEVSIQNPLAINMYGPGMNDRDQLVYEMIEIIQTARLGRTVGKLQAVRMYRYLKKHGKRRFKGKYPQTYARVEAIYEFETSNTPFITIKMLNEESAEKTIKTLSEREAELAKQIRDKSGQIRKKHQKLDRITGELRAQIKRTRNGGRGAKGQQESDRLVKELTESDAEQSSKAKAELKNIGVDDKSISEIESEAIRIGPGLPVLRDELDQLKRRESTLKKAKERIRKDATRVLYRGVVVCLEVAHSRRRIERRRLGGSEFEAMFLVHDPFWDKNKSTADWMKQLLGKIAWLIRQRLSEADRQQRDELRRLRTEEDKLGDELVDRFRELENDGRRRAEISKELDETGERIEKLEQTVDCCGKLEAEFRAGLDLEFQRIFAERLDKGFRLEFEENEPRKLKAGGKKGKSFGEKGVIRWGRKVYTGFRHFSDKDDITRRAYPNRREHFTELMGDILVSGLLVCGDPLQRLGELFTVELNEEALSGVRQEAEVELRGYLAERERKIGFFRVSNRFFYWWLLNIANSWKALARSKRPASGPEGHSPSQGPATATSADSAPRQID